MSRALVCVALLLAAAAWSWWGDGKLPIKLNLICFRADTTMTIVQGLPVGTMVLESDPEHVTYRVTVRFPSTWVKP